jgi:hypothetical protein
MLMLSSLSMIILYTYRDEANIVILVPGPVYILNQRLVTDN